MADFLMITDEKNELASTRRILAWQLQAYGAGRATNAANTAENRDAAADSVVTMRLVTRLTSALALIVVILLTASAAALAAPSVSFIEPVGTTVRGQQVVTVDATAPNGMDRVVFQVDGVTQGADRVAPYTWTIDTTTMADGSVHKLRALAYEVGGTYTALRKDVTVDNALRKALTVDNPPRASFTVTRDKSTITHLDGSASSGVEPMSYAWEVDGAAVGSGEQWDIQPPVGTHHVNLTVTDSLGRTAVTERDIDVVWRGFPWTAQTDTANGELGAGQFLPEMSSLLGTAGPWRTLASLNNGYSAVAQPDGSIALEVHQGDHPGLTGGDRSGLVINEAYTPYVDPSGNTDLLPRFYRMSFMLDPAMTPADMHNLQNNWAEWHGAASGGSVLKIAPNSAGTSMSVIYAKMLQGMTTPPVSIDEHPIVPGEWQNYVIEARWSADPTVGYIRVYRDGVNKTLGVPGADDQGRIFGETLKQLEDGTFEKMAYAIQNYRQKDDRLAVSTTVSASVAAGADTVPIRSTAAIDGGGSTATVAGQTIHYTGKTANALVGVTGLTADVTAGAGIKVYEPLPDTRVFYRDVAIGPSYASVTS